MRYAIYFAPPPGSTLHRQGSAWLGRDAHTGEALAQPDVPGIAAATVDPRRYGFHATLKAPFGLRDGVGVEALMRACAALAADLTPFRMRLTVGELDGFLALVPEGDAPTLLHLAERCVREMDGFRRPLDAHEIARRRRQPLSPSQDQNLLRWGYPFVLDDFRFHMTLTERLAATEGDGLARAAWVHFAPTLADPVLIDGITLFHEAEPGAPFIALRHFPFTRSTAEAAA